MNLNQKRILLTGATGGIGQVLAQLLAEKGASLALVGRDTEKLTALQSRLDGLAGNVHIIEADLAQTGAAAHITAEAHAKLGGVDMLINNAGILDFIGFEAQSPERIAQMVQTNVTALIQLTQLQMPHFLAKNQGHIVLVGSIFGSLGFPHFATYCATKFAVHGFSQALRRELVDTNIKVTYIAPRAVDTPMNDTRSNAMWKKSGNVMDTPEKVAQIIVNAIEQEKQEVFIGQPQSLFAWLNGLAPRVINVGLKKQTALAKQLLK